MPNKVGVSERKTEQLHYRLQGNLEKSFGDSILSNDFGALSEILDTCTRKPCWVILANEIVWIGVR